MQIRRFEDIVAWQMARALVREVYSSVQLGPAKKDFGFRDQICRASVSVMTNIAEGFARRSRTEFKRFLDISRSSAREVQSLLYVGRDLEYLQPERFTEIYDSAGRTAAIVTRLMESLPPDNNP